MQIQIELKQQIDDELTSFEVCFVASKWIFQLDDEWNAITFPFLVDCSFVVGEFSYTVEALPPIFLLLKCGSLIFGFSLWVDSNGIYTGPSAVPCRIYSWLHKLLFFTLGFFFL